MTIIGGMSSKWEEYKSSIGRGFKTEVDLSTYDFEKTPIIFTSLNGISHHWVTMGSSSIYNSSVKKFEIYIFIPEDNKESLTLKKIREKKWSINWIALGKVRNSNNNS